MELILVFASATVASGILFANVYTSLVDAKSWGADIPHSIETARDYFKTVNPGKNFFRILSPPNVVLALLVLIVFWKVSDTVRMYSGLALGLYICVDAFTFAYFYPRNKIMFETTPIPDNETLKKAVNGWSTMNWVRSLVLLAGLVCSFLALYNILLLHCV